MFVNLRDRIVFAIDRDTQLFMRMLSRLRNISGRRSCSAMNNHFHEIGFRQARRMHFASDCEEPAETHEQRTPFHRIDIRTRPIPREERFIHVQSNDVHFEAVGGHILAERPPVVNDAFHLHRTLRDTRRRHGE